MPLLVPRRASARCWPGPICCARFVYDWALALRRDAYRERGEQLFYRATSAALTTLKQQAATAFRERGLQCAAPTGPAPPGQSLHKFLRGTSEIPEVQEETWPSVGGVHHVCVYPTTITLSHDPAGRYFVSFLVEEEIEPLPVSQEIVGIDLGLQDVVTLSTGEKTGNEHFFREEEQRLARLQRRHARKCKGSRNREKARRKVAKLHARIAGRRRDFAHKLTTSLLRENQVVCVESLAVKNLLQNHHLAKAIADVGWGELLRMLSYKAAWYGRTVVAIDRFFPGSKRCSVCGYLCEMLDLDERQWTCPACGTVHDRDTNAAVNIKAEGLITPSPVEARQDQT